VVVEEAWLRGLNAVQDIRGSLGDRAAEFVTARQ
jgi:hypothetical protein